MHVREIERRSGLNDSTIRQELRKLVRLDLVRSRRDSNRVYYRAKTENPLYPEIRNLVLKTSGLVDVLKPALRTRGFARPSSSGPSPAEKKRQAAMLI